LNWSTASESNNDYFSIEQSFDGIHFSEIGTMDGAGNSTSLLNYEFVVPNEVVKGNYFRLRQVDFDGANAITEVIDVECKVDNEEIMLYPNPFNDELVIEFQEMKAENISLKFLDLNGKLVFTMNLERSKNSIRLKEEMFDLAKGVYLVEIWNSDNSSLLQKSKVVKL
jgi:hypothetical protein